MRVEVEGIFVNFRRMPGSAAAGNDALVMVGLLMLAMMALTTSAARAETCAGDRQALGTARTIAVDPAILAQVGATERDAQTLGLRDHEVVLTFDDGPSPATTPNVLDALAAACVKANFFVMGEHAAQAGALVQRAAGDGHTVGTHTKTHADLPSLDLADAKAEIQGGITAAAVALGPEQTLAPFFRAPYLATSPAIEEYLRARGLMLWGIDVDSEDWRSDLPDNVLTRIFAGLNRVHQGIILMHDVQPVTAQVLPTLLQELKARGYKVVHVVPATLNAGTLSAR
jgi:peptidoglycan/xylan/chitin deacetylase (PgdA/CDA1 family)